MLISNPSEDSWSNESWIQKLKSAMCLLLHWMRLACNFCIESRYYHLDSTSSRTMCSTAPHPTWGKFIQAALVYWCFWIIFFLGLCLSCMSREWEWWGDSCPERHQIYVPFFIPNQMVQSLWLCTGGWRHRDWCTRWILMNLSALLQRQHQMHSISYRIGKKWDKSWKKIHYQYGSNPLYSSLLTPRKLWWE